MFNSSSYSRPTIANTENLLKKHYDYLSFREGQATINVRFVIHYNCPGIWRLTTRRRAGPAGRRFRRMYSPICPPGHHPVKISDRTDGFGPDPQGKRVAKTPGDGGIRPYHPVLARVRF